MDNSEKFSKFIIKIIKLTNNGIISWKIDEINTQLNLNENNILLESFSSVLNDKCIRLVKYKTKNISMQAIGSLSYVFPWQSNNPNDTWRDTYSLEIFDEQTNITLHRYPISESSLRDLSNVIKSNLAGADEFMDEVLEIT